MSQVTICDIRDVRQMPMSEILDWRISHNGNVEQRYYQCVQEDIAALEAEVLRRMQLPVDAHISTDFVPAVVIPEPDYIQWDANSPEWVLWAEVNSKERLRQYNEKHAPPRPLEF